MIDFAGDRFVYFIRNVQTGLIKVGASEDPDRRLAELQTGNDCELKLIGAFKAGPSSEREVHDLLADLRVRGEWFAPEALPIVEKLCGLAWIAAALTNVAARSRQQANDLWGNVPRSLSRDRDEATDALDAVAANLDRFVTLVVARARAVRS